MYIKSKQPIGSTIKNLNFERTRPLRGGGFKKFFSQKKKKTMLIMFWKKTNMQKYFVKFLQGYTMITFFPLITMSADS